MEKTETELEKKQRLCNELMGMNLSKPERVEFDNIAENQPVFSGNVLSKHMAEILIGKGLVMHYEGEYVLTDKGQQLKENLISAQKLVDSGILYKK